MIDRKIEAFIEEHHVMTLATGGADTLHCCNLFYVYVPDARVFVATSSAETFHVCQLEQNDRIAASIVLETSVVGQIRGLQIRGSMRRPKGERLRSARKAYLKRFPFAVFMDVDVWVIEPDYFKYTDNRLGFGKKIVWEKEREGHEAE